MNSQVIRNELDALASIFCSDGEFQVMAEDEKEVAILVTPFSLKAKHLTLSVILHYEKYPQEVPKLSVQSSLLKRNEVAVIETSLMKEAEKFKGEAMVLNLIGYLTECIASSKPDPPKEETPQSNTSSDKSTIIIQLDHIRSRQMYVKTLTKWFRELSLVGLLVTHKRLVFLIVTGTKDDLQVYLKRHRTLNVDVDSAGRPCKERLLTLLGEVNENLDVPTDKVCPLNQIEVEERLAYVQLWKSSATLWNIYQKFILPQSEQKK